MRPLWSYGLAAIMAVLICTYLAFDASQGDRQTLNSVPMARPADTVPGPALKVLKLRQSERRLADVSVSSSHDATLRSVEPDGQSDTTAGRGEISIGGGPYLDPDDPDSWLTSDEVRDSGGYIDPDDPVSWTKLDSVPRDTGPYLNPDDPRSWPKAQEGGVSQDTGQPMDPDLPSSWVSSYSLPRDTGEPADPDDVLLDAQPGRRE